MKFQVKITSILLIAASFFIADKANAQTVKDTQLKKNTSPVKNSLDVVSQLRPISFEFNSDAFKKLALPKGKQYGFVAEDLQQILPGLISKEQKWYTAGKNDQRAVTTSKIDYEILIPLLVGAIQEQQAQIDELRSQLKAK